MCDSSEDIDFKGNMSFNQFNPSISNSDDFIFLNKFGVLSFEKGISRSSVIGDDHSSNLEVSILASLFFNLDNLYIDIISFSHVL